MTLFVIAVFIIILRRIISLVSIIIFKLFLGFLSWLFRVIMWVLLLDVVCLGVIRCDWRGGNRRPS